jgi:hypothetical protein
LFSRKARPAAEEEPASLIGAYLFNGLLERQARRDAYLGQALARIASKDGQEWTLLPQVAGTLARGYFRDDLSDEALQAFAAFATSHLPPQSDLHAAAVRDCVRAALTGSTQQPPGVSFTAFISINTLIAALIVRQRNLTARAVLKVIGEAEQDLSQRGVKLTQVR